MIDTDAYKSDLIDVECLVLYVTEKAYGVANNLRRGKPSEIVWLPKSQCERNDDGTITMPKWIAMEKGLI